MPLFLLTDGSGVHRLNHKEVLPVTLAIYQQEEQIQELVSFLSPLPKSLEDKFKQWQYYIGLQGNRILWVYSGATTT